MNKKTFSRLEKLFAAEIEGRLFQTSTKVAPQWILDFIDDDLIEPYREEFPSALGTIVCHGFILTHKGRHLYCSNCKEPTHDK